MFSKSTRVTSTILLSTPVMMTAILDWGKNFYFRKEII